MEEIFDCIIIGAGPSGISSAIELKALGVKTALIDYGPPGGKINIAPRVDNFPPYKKISGPDLAYEFYLRLEKDNINIIPDEIVSLNKDGSFFKVEGVDDCYLGKTVIIASGTKEKKLGLDKEDFYFGKGISYCALCDGHFFKNKNVMVVIGDPHSIKEAIHLSSLCKKVILVTDKEKLIGNPVDIKELLTLSNIEYKYGYKLIKLEGNDHLQKVFLQNLNSGMKEDINVDGLFPLIGQVPNTRFINFDILSFSSNLLVDSNYMTKVEGLFGVGDVLQDQLRQIFVAVKDGKKAAKSVFEYLSKQTF